MRGAVLMKKSNFWCGLTYALLGLTFLLACLLYTSDAADE